MYFNVHVLSIQSQIFPVLMQLKNPKLNFYVCSGIFNREVEFEKNLKTKEYQTRGDNFSI